MRRIVSSMFMSADGVIERPDEWHFPFFSPEMGEVMTASLQSNDAALLGRVMYDEWSVYWPAHIDGDPFGQYINDLPKFVLTHRPVEGEVWTNTTVVSDEHVAQVQALKEAGDGNIGMSGSVSTVRWLIENSLLDELDLLVDPILVGAGRRLFDGDSHVPLELVHSETLPKGVQHLRYKLT